MSTRDNVIATLSRSTIYDRERITNAVDLLIALGWTPHEAMRGISIVAQTGLSLQALTQAAELSTVSVAETLDALVAGGTDPAAVDERPTASEHDPAYDDPQGHGEGRDKPWETT